MAGMSLGELTGGSGYTGGGAPVAPPSANGVIAGALSGKPHVGLIGLVLFAVVILLILDRAGFRFAVTAGKR